METIINAWGGEGILSSAALTIIGAMGLLRNAPNQKIHLRVLDFAMNSGDDDRRRRLAKAYTKYYTIVFGSEPEIVFDEVELDGIIKQDMTKTILGKVGDRDALALGCSLSDMKLNIEKGIYGKPWLGEIYYSDSDFSKLYENFAAGSEVIIINCGGYRGGGTAATFIPVENMYPVNLITHRYTVVAGPSTKFVYVLKMPHPEIYYLNSFRLDQISIFYVPDALKIIKSLSIPDNNIAKHRENIEYLENEYKRVKSETHDYTNLDPRFYSSRFLDRIFSDSSKVEATFINIKTDGDNLLPLDINAQELEPDLQSHNIHISNLLNALSIRAIIFNYQKYKGGKVYSFGTNAGNFYEPDTLFDIDTKEKFWQFIAMAILMSFFVHDSFICPAMPEYRRITDKWANGNGGNDGLLLRLRAGLQRFALNNVENDSVSFEFAKKMLANIETFITDYIRPVFRALREFDNTSDQVKMFGDDAASVIIELLRSSGNPGTRFSRENDPFDYIPRLITNIMTDISWFSNKERNTLYSKAAAQFENYITEFPELKSEMNDDGAEKYFAEIVGYTMNKAADFIKR